MTDPVVLRRDSGIVRWLTLNRPRVANAIDTVLADALATELGTAAEDDSVRAVVLSGAGGRSFCAGVDIKAPDTPAQRRRNLRACMWAVLDFPKPLVAAINGVASGGGCMLALLADTRVMAESSALALPEIDLGIPTYVGFAIVAGLTGDALALDLVLSGRRMNAREAARWNLAEATSEDLGVAAEARATALAAKPPSTYRLCKAFANQRRRAAIEAATESGERLEKA